MAKEEKQRISRRNLSPEKAVNLLEQQAKEIPAVSRLQHSSSEFRKWHDKTKAVVRAVFGEPSPQSERFARILYSPEVLGPWISDTAFQKVYLDGLRSAESALETFIFEVKTLQITDGGPAPDPTISERQSFLFLRDLRIRAIVERDYAELQQLRSTSATKAKLVAAGGIIEAVLLDALVASGKWTFEQAQSRPLSDTIGPALNAGIISEDRLTHAVRKYRALVHAAREIRDGVVFGEADAAVAVGAVDVILREARAWYEAQDKDRSKT